jgi:glycosyltransferase involved in cell wall biosynthesis
MRIAVVAPSPVPFRTGGAERLFDGLTTAINERTEHAADLIKLPAPEHSFLEILDSYERFSELDVSHFDLVITTKYPSWMVKHPNKVLYLLHTLRGLYDAYHFTSEPIEVINPPESVARLLASLTALEEGTGQLPAVFSEARRAVELVGIDDPVFRFPGPLIRRFVHALDRVGLSPPQTRRHFSISRTVADRDYFPPGVTSGVAYPPSNLTGFRQGESDFLFTASRLDVPKRIDLIIEAFREADLRIPLKIAGTGEEMPRLVELAGGDPRIEFLGRVSDDRMIDLYADALAVPFAPYDEDLGLITLEAMHCGTPVITCSDSGGPTELVDHGVNGFIAEPEPASLAAAFSALGRDPARARAMAPAALETARSVTWDAVVSKLLGEEGGDGESETVVVERMSMVTPQRIVHERPHIVVLSTYPFFPSESGGRIRGASLIKGLLSEFDIEIIATARQEERAATSTPLPGVTQRIVRLPDAIYRREREWMVDVDWTPISDVVPGLLIREARDYLNAVAAASQGASAIMLSHSYLVDALPAVESLPPILLDAVDLEVIQKQRALPDSPTGSSLKRAVEILERSATHRADLITICSPDDATAMAAYYSPSAPLELIPNGTAVDDIDFVTLGQRTSNSRAWLERFNSANSSDYRAMALFVASWHPPNLDAARHLMDMAVDVRDVVFVLAGSHSRYFDEWTVPPNVVRSGFVSDAVKRGLLSAATMALNPMNTGSGTNLKILEYWAAGVPTVSTPFGVRGLDVVAGEHYVEAPIEAFPEEIERIAEGDDALEEMVRNARSIVEHAYDWRTIGTRFRSLVQELVL